LNQPKLLKTDDMFWNKHRLSIFLFLYKNKKLSFSELKKHLSTTDGNLASYMRAIEKSGFIEVHKEFIDKRPRTSYNLTQDGIHQLRRFTYLLSLHLDLD
jgi:DNA-binding HxlR family transcriptional regulator